MDFQYLEDQDLFLVTRDGKSYNMTATQMEKEFGGSLPPNPPILSGNLVIESDIPDPQQGVPEAILTLDPTSDPDATGGVEPYSYEYQWYVGGIKRGNFSETPQQYEITKDDADKSQEIHLGKTVVDANDERTVEIVSTPIVAGHHYGDPTCKEPSKNSQGNSTHSVSLEWTNGYRNSETTNDLPNRVIVELATNSSFSNNYNSQTLPGAATSISAKALNGGPLNANTTYH